MKKTPFIILLTGILCGCISCRKNSTNASISTLNIVQAIYDIPAVYLYFTGSPANYYLQQSSVTYASGAEYGIPSGITPVTIVSATDTTRSLLQTTFILKPGGIYSFYLAGQSSHIDTLFVQDQLPFYADSSAGVRFINLSPGSQPISINIAGNPGTQTEFANLGYKQISTFKTYSAASSAGGLYNFEIRDQASDSLLTTYSWNYALRKNNTIVISGLENTSLNLFSVNNY